MVDRADGRQHGIARGHLGAKIVAKSLRGLGARTADFTFGHAEFPLHRSGFALPRGDRLGKSRSGKMDRLDSLEERCAHLIRAVEDLSDVVARQGREIDVLTRRVHLLMEREAERETTGAEAPAADVKPPHW